MHLIESHCCAQLSLQRFLPPERLAADVDNFQHLCIPQAGPLPRILPGNGALALIPVQGALRLTNVHSGESHALHEPSLLCNRHHVLDLSAPEPAQFLVVSFRPGRLRHFGGACFADLQDRVTAARLLWGTACSGLGEQLDEAGGAAPAVQALAGFLETRLRRSTPGNLDSLLDKLYLEPERRISDLALDAGLSLRQFERRFVSAYGVTPKYFARVARLQRVARRLALDPVSSTVLSALDAGFFDQSHFVHELRRLADLSPSELTRGVRERPHFYNPVSLQRYAASLARGCAPARQPH